MVTSRLQSHGNGFRATLFALAGLLLGGSFETAGAGSPSRAANPENPKAPQSVGWRFGSPMSAARSGHTATLLSDGRVLVIGGGPAGAEMFDPAHQTWSAAPLPNEDRVGATATLLPNGKVLLVGGVVGAGPMATVSVEIWSPASNSWSDGPRMQVGRAHHTATLLQDGRILVAGGDDGTGALVGTFEIYDPTDNSWSEAVSSSNVECTRHFAVLLPNGKVLVGGGLGSAGALASAGLYNPTKDGWSDAGALVTARANAGALVLPDGTVLVAGGTSTAGVAIAAAERYTPATDSWTGAGTPAPARSEAAFVLLPNGKVLLAGGRTGASSWTVNSQLYDPVSGIWSPAEDLSPARGGATATILRSGTVLVAGGRNSAQLSGALLFDSSDPSSSAVVDVMSSARYGFTATLLPNATVLVVGGADSAGASLAAAELFDPTTSTFDPTASLGSARAQHSATLLSDGNVLVVGGIEGGSALASAEIYSPSPATFAPAASLSVARSLHTATLLADGRVLVAGGLGAGGTALGQAEIFDPATATFSSVSAIGTARYRHTATLLTNGTVLLAGGADTGGAPLNSAEVFDPSNGSFTPLAFDGLFEARFDHTATLLPNGSVLFAGGSGALGMLSSLELFRPGNDPGSPGIISPVTAVLASARSGHTATFLGTDRVLFAGGGSPVAPLGDAELFDFEDSTVALSTILMVASRTDAAALLLADGRVLLAGGRSSSLALSTAELFDPGLGFAPSRRPQIATCPTTLAMIDGIALTGSGFRGDSEAAGAAFHSSASDHPILGLERIEGGLRATTDADPASLWSGTLLTSAAVAGLPTGHYRLNVTANGIPSGSRILLISRGATSTSLVAAPDPSCLGANVTATASVTPASATGSVGFYEGASLMGSAPLSAGSAAFPLPPLATGFHSLTARYAGSTSHLASLSAPALLVEVKPHPLPPTAGNSGPICEGETLFLTASSLVGATYSWSGPNGFSSTTQNPAIPAASLASAGDYSVVATVDGCASTAAMTSAVVNAIPVVDRVFTNSPVCPGRTLWLSGGGSRTQDASQQSNRRSDEGA